MSSHLRRRAPGNRLAVASLLVVALGLRDHAQPFSQPVPPTPSPTNAVAAHRPAQPGATDAAAHPDLHQPAGSELAGLIPTRLRGATVEVPPTSEFAMTPGDFAAAYGDLGLQFRALQVAYVNDPRLSLYAARVEPAADHPPAGAVPGDGRPLRRHRRPAS